MANSNVADRGDRGDVEKDLPGPNPAPEEEIGDRGDRGDSSGSRKYAPETSALFPELVDLVIKNESVRYLVVSGGSMEVVDEWRAVNGRILRPPELDSIPYEPVRADRVFRNIDGSAAQLYYSVLEKLRTVSVLPSDAHYHLCTVYVFFTHLSERAPYLPYLWFFGLPERGKSRMVKVLTRLSWRGLYTETLNEAYIFRFAESFAGTIGLDVYELSGRAQKKGSHDLLLGRFDEGMKVPRVIAPEKGPFKDMRYYRVAGPTILATNTEIPAKDPLRSRCLKITMPEARGIYPNHAQSDLFELRAGLLAFRARHLNKSLPDVAKPVAGRLGDLMQPLLSVAALLPREATENIKNLIRELEAERQEAEAETLAGRIVTILFSLQNRVVGGWLPVEIVTQMVNMEVPEQHQVASQKVGHELSALGIVRKKKQGKMHILWKQDEMEKLFNRFGLDVDTFRKISPFSPFSQNRVVDTKNGGEMENEISPISLAMDDNMPPDHFPLDEIPDDVDSPID
jgi:hypothetical protein